MDYTSYVYIAIALLPFIVWGSIIVALSNESQARQQSRSGTYNGPEQEPATEISIIPYGLIFPLHYSYPSDRRNFG
ncbi:hypothetical protein [Ochrobactrum sp. AN78]|jgi:hypothetical protein|uniref:Uncharacterized protein n=1 Tax=Ochrobactrum quorumnocens TaxID=271865 RepID=A0A5N1KCM5_9HYPH|nr:hypothetical protein [Ochrobactrum sp. AN78]KAA9371025.1 hypothetical protein F3W84_01045 [[Ochrobactrum] quorumnocens]MBD7991334.1 hypothetical protein [Ochrobactrum gallinarum]MDH7791534.1 hypothetical protein [Ochrobactrum sp. AN78]